MQNNQTVGEYPFPSLCTETVPPLLLSRYLLLRLCSCYLVSENYHAGLELLEKVFYNVRRVADGTSDDSENIFAIHGQLITTDLTTVYTDHIPDPELILFYVKFLILTENTNHAVFVLSALPHGMKYEPDFVMIAAYLVSSIVRN